MSSLKVEGPFPRRRIRWRPAVNIVVLTTVAVAIVRLLGSVAFQRRNEVTLGIIATGFLALFIWWTLFSRARWKLRLGAIAVSAGCLVLVASLFRVRGFSGDLMPILEPRWTQPAELPAEPVPGAALESVTSESGRPDYPQFLGPSRTGILAGPALDPDWESHPPKVMWRHPVGVAWSGFSVVGNRAFTQEQRDDQECVVCYNVLNGEELWVHADAAHFNTTLGGEGPRATPTVVSNRVFALGATGWLNCLDAETGRKIWARNLVTEDGGREPEWGYAGSPLVWQNKVIVCPGGDNNNAMRAYDFQTGTVVWSGGNGGTDYGSPFPATLAGVEQILVFNHKRASSNDARDGRLLWEYPWGIGHPCVANPVLVGSNDVVFSSGYGIGSKRFTVERNEDGTLSVKLVWQTNKMKAKFANPVACDGYLYGLDDGILECVDLKDGSQRWKQGHYGHGQGLLVKDLYLLMAENGELVLLRPTPEGPNELARFPVFDNKTWNPFALAGDVLLARNDREAVCLRLALAE